MDVDVFHGIVKNFKKLTGIDLGLVQSRAPGETRLPPGSTLVQLRHHAGSPTFHLIGKSRLSAAQLPGLRGQVSQLNRPLIMAEYISTESRRQLKQWQISYLDAGGNAFLKNKEVLVYVETGKNHAPPVHKNNRAFGKAGLKVIYQALLNPVILNQPYRQIGQRAMVTIDTVGKVIRALLEHKYLVKVDRRNYRLVRREQLFFEWVTLFNRVLRPKLKQRRYQLLVPSVNLSELPLAAESVWGGEVAAQQLGATLLPERVIIYTALPFTDIMQKWRLLPSEVGNITLFEALWRFDHDRADQPEKAPSPVLTYADLLYQATPRSLEAAEQIYQTHVQTNL